LKRAIRASFALHIKLLHIVFASTTLTVGETEVEQRGKHSAALKPYKPHMVRFGVVVWSIKCFVKT